MQDVRINRQAIQSLVNTTGRTKKFIWDREVPGFGVYKTSAGRPTFVYQYRSPLDKKVVYRLTIGWSGELTVEQARDIARGYAHQRRNGIDPTEAKKRAEAEAEAARELLLSPYIEDFIERRQLRGEPVSVEVQAIYRRDILGELGNVRLDKLTFKDAEKAKDRLANRSPSAARWFITYLKALLNDAIDRELLVKSPVFKIPTPLPTERDRVLTHIEMQRFVEACSDIGDARGDVYELLLRLLRRKEEIAAIVWEEIDQQRWVWSLPGDREKTSSSMRIPLPPQVVAILKRQQLDPTLRSGIVFTLNGGRTSVDVGSKLRAKLNAMIDRRVELAAARDGGVRLFIPHFTIHDLRTTAATIMGEDLSIAPHVIEVLLNHTLGNKMQRKYQRATFQAAMREALVKWNDHVDAIMTEPSTWPGGSDLPRMKEGEINARHATLTATWPKRPSTAKKNDATGTTD